MQEHARKEEEVGKLTIDADAHGPQEVCVFNIGANVNFPILETTERVFRKSLGDSLLRGVFGRTGENAEPERASLLRLSNMERIHDQENRILFRRWKSDHLYGLAAARGAGLADRRHSRL
jgi:hypothetical protein